jgi:hypothetical protein
MLEVIGAVLIGADQLEIPTVGLWYHGIPKIFPTILISVRLWNFKDGGS